MRIEVEYNKDYDTGIHPEVAEISFHRRTVGTFLEDDRFPNLVMLDRANPERITTCSLLRFLP